MFRVDEVAGQVEITWSAAAAGLGESLFGGAVIAVPLAFFFAGVLRSSFGACVALFGAVTAVFFGAALIDAHTRMTVTVDRNHLRVGRRPIGLHRKFVRGDIAHVTVEQVTHTQEDGPDWNTWAVKLVTKDERATTIADLHRESDARFLASRLRRALGQGQSPAEP